jgi:hypothetical protein
MASGVSIKVGVLFIRRSPRDTTGVGEGNKGRTGAGHGEVAGLLNRYDRHRL